MLRRLKNDVDFFIPKKREFVLYCAFQPTQRALYDLIFKRDVNLYVSLII
jgi:SNF2 family DNA or RNA helicase